MTLVLLAVGAMFAGAGLVLAGQWVMARQWRPRQEAAEALLREAVYLRRDLIAPRAANEEPTEAEPRGEDYGTAPLPGEAVAVSMPGADPGVQVVDMDEFMTQLRKEMGVNG